jgi:succinate dehydrogenase / fumarate reductase membrane anchor subunit
MYDLAMLVLAMLHGVNGARYMIDDYVHPPMWRRLALGALFLVCGGFLALGIYVALFFQAPAA